jgi:MFS transporter, PPP family, 3-phenylpropionic acid transporter
MKLVNNESKNIVLNEYVDGASEEQRSNQKKVCCSKIFILKILYFLAGLSGTSWGRYSAIFYVACGLTPFQIGAIGCTIPFVRLVAQPIWGVVSDKLRNRKAVYLFTTTLNTLSILTLSISEVSDAFWKIIVVAIVTASFVAGGILDAYALEILKEQGQVSDYGKIRLWTAVSWGGGTSIMGFVIDKYGFSMMFIIFGSFQVINFLIMAWCIPNVTDAEKEALENNEKAPEIKYLLRALFCSPRICFLLFLIAIFGAGFGVVGRLLFVYLLDEFNATKLLCGLTVGATVVFEIPIFYYGKEVLDYLGPSNMMIIAMVSFIIRMFGYTWLTKSTLYYILLLELLHGLTFAMMWTATVDISSKIAPKGWKTATMTIISAFLSCLGGGVGALAGGYVAQRYSFKFLFHATGYLFSAVLVVHLIATFCGLFDFSNLRTSDRENEIDNNLNGALIQNIGGSRNVSDGYDENGYKKIQFEDNEADNI